MLFWGGWHLRDYQHEGVHQVGPAADGDDGDGQGGRFAPETSVTDVTASRYGRFRVPQAKIFPILKRFQRNFFDFEQIQTPRISQHFTTLHNI